MGLEPRYQLMLQRKDWKEYIAALHQDSLKWCFRLEPGLTSAHLEPLFSAGLQHEALTPRLRLFHEIGAFSFSKTTIENLRILYEELKDVSDFDGLAALVVATTNYICDTRNNLDQLDLWDTRLNRLVGSENVSKPAKICLMAAKGKVEQFEKNDLTAAEEAFKTAFQWSRKLKDPSIQVAIAGALCEVYLIEAKIAECEMFFFEVEPLVSTPGIAVFPKFIFLSSHAFYLHLTGDLVGALTQYQQISDILEKQARDFNKNWWNIHVNRYLAAACSAGSSNLIDDLSNRINQELSANEDVLAKSLLHFSLGYLEVSRKNNPKVELHSHEIDRVLKQDGFTGFKSLSHILLAGILSNQGRFEDALSILDPLPANLSKMQHNLFSVFTLIEKLNIYGQQKDVTHIRVCLSEIEKLWTFAYPLPDLFRPTGFSAGLMEKYDPDIIQLTSEPKEAVIRIKTFGALELSVLQKGQWLTIQRPASSKLLLGIILLGGQNVSVDQLIDLLWPDQDGDRAYAAFKVALSRLRNSINQAGPISKSWLTIKQHHVSLDPDLCEVDAIRFTKAIDFYFKKKKNPYLLLKALELHEEEFLARERDLPWSGSHRDHLHDQYIQALVEYAGKYHSRADMDRAIHYLKKVLTGRPFDEQLCEALMKCYINSGYPSMALGIYHKTRTAIQESMGAEPGPKLKALVEDIQGEMVTEPEEKTPYQ